MGKLIYTVVIEFEDKVVDDNEIKEVAQHIAEGLILQAHGEGLAPLESETYTKSVEVAKDGVVIAKENF